MLLSLDCSNQIYTNQNFQIQHYFYNHPIVNCAKSAQRHATARSSYLFWRNWLHQRLRKYPGSPLAGTWTDGAVVFAKVPCEKHAVDVAMASARGFCLLDGDFATVFCRMRYSLLKKETNMKRS